MTVQVIAYSLNLFIKNNELVFRRYEAASTIYGPHTLTIYLWQFNKLMQAMIKNISLEPGPSPSVMDNKVISLTPPVFFDNSPLGTHFGDVIKQPRPEYIPGDQVNVHFVSGNPRNNLQHESSYLTVEKYSADQNWTVFLTDASWETL